MSRIDAAGGLLAATLPIPTEPIPAGQVRGGSPRAGFVVLDETDDRTIGIWEHTPGVSTDVEADEVFVVLSGAGTLEFVEPEAPPVELCPGVVVRLAAGMRTLWTIHETVRKVYVI
ncbi:MAG: cupin domain-containing protein [Intrasporangium sp.]|uniref:cupin domain-containing protein n=1 Tax=Intrasporangium sp. TaxID=1925024 RepID=UPI003F7E9FD3